jgi:hypothetical protein
MRKPVRSISTIAIGLFVAVTATGLAQRRGTAPTASTATPADATARIVAAAQAVVATLDEAGKAKVQFPFEGPQKTKWSNLPSPMFQREGVRLADLTAPQRAAIDTLLTTALSRDGYRKVKEIMLADGVLPTPSSPGAVRRQTGVPPTSESRGRPFTSSTRHSAT